MCYSKIHAILFLLISILVSACAISDNLWAQDELSVEVSSVFVPDSPLGSGTIRGIATQNLSRDDEIVVSRGSTVILTMKSGQPLEIVVSGDIITVSCDRYLVPPNFKYCYITEIK